jgi:hypothetical protein
MAAKTIKFGQAEWPFEDPGVQTEFVDVITEDFIANDVFAMSFALVTIDLGQPKVVQKVRLRFPVKLAETVRDAITRRLAESKNSAKD